MKRLWFFIISVAISAASCSTNPGFVGVSMVSLDKVSAKVSVWASPITLTATVFPENASDKRVFWSSSNPSVASVENGVVTPHKVGHTFISVVSNDGGKSARCRVDVYEEKVLVDLMALSSCEMTLRAGGVPGWVVPTVIPLDAENKDVVWSSSDESVATVRDGAVFPLSEGVADIKATALAGGAEAICRLTVKPVSAAQVTVNDIYLNKTELSLSIGEYAKLISTVLPSDADNKNVVRSVSDASVADVFDCGIIVGIGKGSTIVTAKTVDGGLDALCSVTVE